MSIANIILNVDRCFLPRSGSRQRSSLSPLLCHIIGLPVPANAVSVKGYIGWERRNKTNFVPNDIIIYVENPKEMTNKQTSQN